MPAEELSTGPPVATAPAVHHTVFVSTAGARVFDTGSNAIDELADFVAITRAQSVGLAVAVIESRAASGSAVDSQGDRTGGTKLWFPTPQAAALWSFR